MIKKIVQTLKKPQHHNIWSYGYKLICVDQQHDKSYNFFFEKYVFDKLIRDIISFNKLLIMTWKSCEDFKVLLNPGFIRSSVKKKMRKWKIIVMLVESKEYNVNISLTKISLSCFIIWTIVMHILYFTKLQDIMLHQKQYENIWALVLSKIKRLLLVVKFH